MDANHVRPMLAFGLLAAIAAMITSLGLHDTGSAVTVRAGSPSPVSRSGSPELVLGGVLHAAPGLDAVAVSSRGSLPAPAVGYTTGAEVWPASPHTPVVPPRPRSKKSSTTTHTRATRAPRPVATTTTRTPPKPGRGHHADGHGRPAKVADSIRSRAWPALITHGKSHGGPHGHGGHRGRSAGR